MAARKRVLTRTNAEAVELALKQLALEPQHTALEQAARSLAGLLDVDPDAALWREYRQVLDMLAKAGDGGSDDDSTAFLVSIQTPGVRSSVRHTKKS